MPSTPRFVFISYAHQDGSDAAAYLSEQLAKAGHHPWRDTEQLSSRGGDRWDDVITEQLLSAELVVVVLTPAACRSDIVHAEFTKALENRLTVVPALFVDCDIPLGLARLQRLDFQTSPETTLTNLLQQLERLNDPGAEIRRNQETLERLVANRERAHRQGISTVALDDRIQAVGGRIQAFSRDLDAQAHRVPRELEEVRRRAAVEPLRGQGAGVRRAGRLPPLGLGDTFYDRVDQQHKIAASLLDPKVRMVSVLGRGGMGKSALAVRVLEDLARNTGTSQPLHGLVSLFHTPMQPITLDRILLYVAQTLPAEAGARAERLFSNRDLSTRDRVDQFLDLVTDGLVIVLLDNCEDLLDERGHVCDADLELFIKAVLAGAHSLRLLVTARAAINLPPVDLRAAREVTLKDGLPEADAMALLRELDPNATIGLAEASESALRTLAENTYAIPRALELVVNILGGEDGPEGLSSRLDEFARTFWTRETIVERLVEANYRRIPPDGRRVAEALAVFDTPVPRVAVDFLLQPYLPGLRLDEVLAPLVNQRLVSVNRGDDNVATKLALHRVDRDFLYHRLPLTGSYAAPALHSRAAEYYRSVRTAGPRSWSKVTELTPQLLEYEQLVRAGEFDAAAILLSDYAAPLAHCGHPTQCRDLFRKLPDRFTTHSAHAAYWLTALIWKAYLGPVHEGLSLGERALEIARDLNDVELELRIRAELVIAYRYANESAQSRVHAEQIRERIADLPEGALPDVVSDHQIAFDLVLVHVYQGDIRRAAPLARRGHEIAVASGKPAAIATALNGLVVLSVAWGRYAEAIRFGRDAEKIWEDSFHDGLAYIQNLMGIAYYFMDDFPSAVNKLNDAIATADDRDSPRPEALALWNLSLIHLLHGVHDSALRFGQKAEALMLRLSLDRAAAAPRMAAEAAMASDASALVRALMASADEWTRCGDLLPGPVLIRRAGHVARVNQLDELVAQSEAMEESFRLRQTLPDPEPAG